MNTTERQAVLSLASIFALRMLGVFMILPLFSLYAQNLKGTTPFLIGLAMGSYGLTQALFQIPCGMLSDYYNRKRVIALGLLLFVIGSAIAATTDSITGIITGRALQGIGAVGSATMALVADLTRIEQRTKAMAIIGMTIGAAFALGMVMGPLMNQWLTVPAIFWLTAGFGLLCIGLLFTWVPAPACSAHHDDVEVAPAKLFTVLQNAELLRLNLGIFVLHAILTASFMVLPTLLQNTLKLPLNHQWMIYLPVLFASCLVMLPFMLYAEKKQQTKLVFIAAVTLIAISQALLWLVPANVFSIVINLLGFFTAFTLLEALLPSLISKMAPLSSKGTAMGIYSSCQFLGIFIGGLLGGYLYGQHHSGEVFFVTTLMAIAWLILALGMQKPLPHKKQQLAASAQF